MRGLVVRPAARASPGASHRPQGKVTGQPHHRVPRAMPPVWRCVSRQSHLAAFEKEASKCPPARVSQGSSDDVSCREMAKFSKSREEHHAWSSRYATEVHDSPLRTGRTEREHMASWFGVNPTTGCGVPRRCLGWRRRRGRRRVSRVAAVRGDRRGACRAVGEEIPWGTVSLRHLAPRFPFVRCVPEAHSDIGGGRSPQAVRE